MVPGVLCSAVFVGVLVYLFGYCMGLRAAAQRAEELKSPAARYGAKMSYDEWQAWQELERRTDETFGSREPPR